MFKHGLRAAVAAVAREVVRAIFKALGGGR